MHISEELKAANARANEAETQLAAANAQVETLNSDNQALVVNVQALTERVESLEGEIQRARETAASFATVTEGLVEEAAARQAASIVAKCGIEQPELETADLPVKGSGDVWATFEAITDPAEKRRFWNENRADMVAAARSVKH